MPATLAISATPAIPAMDKLSKWSFQNIRRVVREMFRSHRRIVSAPVGPITAHAEPVIIVESTDDEPMFLPDLSYTSPYASGIIDDGATSPKNLLFNPLELSPLSAPETLLTPSTPGSSSIDLSLSGLSGATGRLQVPSFPSSAGINRVRSASAPPIMPSPKPPIVADIVCLGAAKDSQLAYDDRSLAKLLLELYDTFGDEPTLYQLLLWITRRVRKPQIPQLSSSRDLSNDWHRAFLV
ncbi:hypothetical protein CALVIDRAFT_267559 [Calocera viscosa TUFC12733]|uniref:Uncharacterized protein n=1 Tax=Calocera viscosa (strain TUFC12733) TaxID=1330018 RepID=A0A167IYA9_CALVF|nr:hypothetical protein CALVIDRAFT_267559 [Calocera viscosa TUFC12733]